MTPQQGHEDSPEKARPIQIPPHRTFRVRKLMPGENGPQVVEYVITAHMFQYEGGDSRAVLFLDYLKMADGQIIQFVHRAFFNVEDVEEITSAIQGSRLIS